MPISTNYTNITQCRCCHGKELIPQFAFEKEIPLAGNFSSSLEEAKNAELFPLTLVQCQNCGVVQVKEDISDEVLYSKYNYDSSSIPALVVHFKNYADRLIQANGDKDGFTFLEIGANSFPLIQHLPKNWNIIAVDPSDVAKRASEDPRFSHVKLFNEGFDLDFVKKNKLESTIDHIFCFNHVSYLSDLKPVFEGISIALKPNGLFCAELKNLDVILDKKEWDNINHMNKVIYSLHSLVKICSLVGLFPTFNIRIKNGGLRVFFSKKKFLYDNSKDIKFDRLKFDYFNIHYKMRFSDLPIKNIKR